MDAAYAVEESEHAARSPALALIYEGINELVQEGFATWRGISTPVSPTDGVIYAVSRSDGDVVGVICFAPKADQKTVEVTLGYVEPSSRRQRVFARLWDALLYRVNEMGFSIVAGQVHANNNVAQIVCRKLRGIATLVSFEHRVS